MDSPPPAPRVSILELALIVVFLTVVAILAGRPLFAVDLFWHLQLGEVIAATGAIPETDLFSAVHPESAWIQFQWLWEWLAHEVVSTGGLTGLRLMQSLSMTLGFGALYTLVRRREGAAAAALICALALLFLGDRFRVRPDGVNILAFIAALPILLGGWRTWGRFMLPWTFALAALWSNLHGGGSLLLILMTGAIATGSLADHLRSPSADTRKDRTRALGVCLAATLGVLSNPILLDGLAHFASIFTAATERIPNPEWNATWSFLLEGSHPHHLGVALLPTVLGLGWVVERLWTFREGRWKSGDTGEALLATGLLIIAHYWVRTAFLSLIPAYFLIREGRARGWFSPRALLITSAFIGLCTLHYQVERGRGGWSNTLEMAAYDLEPTVFPERAADFIVEAQIEGPVFNQGKWGGYLIWRTWPACHVFFDTRHNLTEPLWDLLVQSLHPSRRPESMHTAFTEHGLELAVFQGPVFPLLRPPPEWILLYKAGPEEVYQHRDGQHAAENIARAHAWLDAQDSLAPATSTASIPDRISRVGGRQWMNSPWRTRRMVETATRMTSSDPQERLRALFLQASRLHRADHHPEAVALFTQLLEAQPGHARARIHLALSHHMLGNRGELLRALRPLASQGPDGLLPFEVLQAEALFRKYNVSVNGDH